MKTGFLHFKRRLLLGLAIILGIFSQVTAQTIVREITLSDQIGSDVSGMKVLYAKVTPVDSVGDGLIDCVFTLTEGDFSSWSDMSIGVRFKNDVDDDYIDARNGTEAYSYDTEVSFSMGKEYDVWIDIDTYMQEFSVYVDGDGVGGPVKVANNFSFRKTPVSKLDMCYAVAGTALNPMNIENLALVSDIGEYPETSSVENNNCIDYFNIYPNPFNDQIGVEAKGQFSYEIININGEILSEGNAENNLLIGYDLNPGMYILKLMKDDNVVCKKIIKQ